MRVRISQLGSKEALRCSVEILNIKFVVCYSSYRVFWS